LPATLTAELDALMSELDDVAKRREPAAAAESEARKSANQFRQRQLDIEVRIAVKPSQLSMLRLPEGD
jgi:hypothetical protein